MALTLLASTDQELLGSIQSRRAHHIRTHRALDQESRQSIAYWLSQQWSMIHPVAGIWAPMQADYEVRHTSNLIGRVIDGKRSKLGAMNPHFSVTPRKGEASSSRSAVVDQAALDWAYLSSSLDRKMADADWWLCLSPVVFLYFGWDPFAGTSRMMSVPDAETGGPMLDPMTGEPQWVEVHEGMPAAEVVSCFEMGWDPAATSTENWRWCYRDKIVPVEEIEERYNKTISPERVDSEPRFWYKSPINLVGTAPGVPLAVKPTSIPEEEGLCLITEFWHVPCKKYPDGLRAIITKNEVVDVADHPFDHKKLPFVAISERPVGGSIDGDFVARRLIQPQDELNRRLSQVIQNCVLTSNPILRYERLSGLNWGELKGFAGKTMAYDMPRNERSVPPDWMNGAQLGQAVYEDISRILDLFFRIAETETLTQDISPDASAIAIQRRMEHDDSILGQTRNAKRFALRDGGKMWLSCFKQFLPSSRWIRIAGSDKAPFLLDPEEVEPDVDVDVEIESGTEHSKLANNAVILDLLKIAAQVPVPGTAEVMQELAQNLEAGNIARVFRVAKEDNAFVDRQIRRVKLSGRPEAPLPYENLQKTSSLLRAFLVSQDYEAWQDPAKTALLQTWQLKKQQLEAQQMAVQQQAMQQSVDLAKLKGQEAAAAKGAPMAGPAVASGPGLSSEPFP